MRTGCNAKQATDAGDVDAADGAPGDSVLCVGDAGPVDGGSPAENPAVPGVSRWCSGPQLCDYSNGGWECCVTSGPSATCIGP